jgi:uncharacterized membrane protein
MANGSESRQGNAPRSGTAFWGGGLAVLIAGGYLAFRILNPIIAAALVILATTVLGIAALARDWDQHPGYEEREQARAERRKVKFAENQGARDKDRAKWEAHQARQRQKEAQQAADGTTSAQ